MNFTTSHLPHLIATPQFRLNLSIVRWNQTTVLGLQNWSLTTTDAVKRAHATEDTLNFRGEALHNIQNMYSCVEFGRLGCTRFIFIKEVPCFTMTFWLKSLDPKVAFLLWRRSDERPQCISPWGDHSSSLGCSDPSCGCHAGFSPASSSSACPRWSWSRGSTVEQCLRDCA